MEFTKDLLKKDNKSVFRIFLGIMFFIISIVWIGDRMKDNMVISPFDWIYTAIFALNGVVHTIEGFGFSILGLIGKAFVRIDDEKISIKPKAFFKEQIIWWKSIHTIDYKFNKFYFQNNDHKTIIMDLSRFDYSLKNEIKEIIHHIAREKNIASINSSSITL